MLQYRAGSTAHQSRSLAVAVAVALAVTTNGCEGSGAHVVGPAGREAFTTYVAIGTGLSMGVQSGGVLYNSQVQAWPALLAHQAGGGISTPLLRGPGCAPPLIAPLQLSSDLAGASATVRDTSCAGALGTIVPPTNNVALSGATAFTALNLTPKLVAATPLVYDIGDRSRYPLVLGNTQSQVTAMMVQSPSFVSVELGLGEVLGAVTTGRVIAATAYGQAAPNSWIPSTVFAPVFASIADSVKKSRARALLFGVPKLSGIAGLRTGDELYADRVAFASFGITVSGNCSGSANLVFAATLVPALVSTAQASGTAQTLSCADVAGAVDYVLTPADVSALNASIDQMNAQIKGLADQNGWAFVDANSVFTAMVASRPAYSVAAHLSCVLPYGQYVSLDGVFPNTAGHELLVNAAAAAVNAKYGFAIPSLSVTPVTAAQLCP
jgi:hypothetical protein